MDSEQISKKSAFPQKNIQKISKIFIFFAGFADLMGNRDFR